MIDNIMAIARAAAIEIRYLLPTYPDLNGTVSSIVDNCDGIIAFIINNNLLLIGSRNFRLSYFQLLPCQHRRAGSTKLLMLAGITGAEDLFSNCRSLSCHGCIRK